jgi:hypothetical protein
MPAPKSRASATWCASTLTTASMAVAVVAVVVALTPTVALTLMLALALIQVELSAHAVLAGHEKRASMQRTARGRGEHAYRRPAPVALLMHVWRGAHEMPLPQSLVLGRMVGIAETLQTSIATINNDAFTFMLCELCWVGFITICYFYSCIHARIKMGGGVNNVQ